MTPPSKSSETATNNASSITNDYQAYKDHLDMQEQSNLKVKNLE